MKTDEKQIFIEDSLQNYFFENLSQLNATLSAPLPEETIFYSSQVLNTMAKSANFFEILENGEIREKMLGVKFLESWQLPKGEQKSELKDIGDTSMCLCGVFTDNISNKIVDQSYYIKLGRTAYSKLNALEPDFLGISNFYMGLSEQFETIVNILSLFTRDFFKDHGFIIKIDPFKVSH